MKSRIIGSLAAGLFCIFNAGQLTAQPIGLSAGLSIETPNYERIYITPAAEAQFAVSKGIEFEAGLGLGINVDSANNPRFILPLWGGLNVVFGESRDFQWLIGLGIKPQITFGTDTAQFLIGPYVKVGLRVGIHPMASWILEAEQTLLIGPPKWINTGTKVFTGINFALSAPK